MLISFLLCHMLEQGSSPVFQSRYSFLSQGATFQPGSPNPCLCFASSKQLPFLLISLTSSTVQKSSVCCTVQVDLCSEQRCRLSVSALKSVFKNAGTVGCLQSQAAKQVIPWNVFQDSIVKVQFLINGSEWL